MWVSSRTTTRTGYMAVTIQDIAVALRLSGDGTDLPQAQQSIIARLQGVAEAHISLLTSDLPQAVEDEAVIRMAAYLYDMPTAGRRDSYANAFINSGAGSLLAHWTPRAMASSTGFISSPVEGEGLSVSQVQDLIDAALVDYITTVAFTGHEGTPNVHHTPPAPGGLSAGAVLYNANFNYQATDGARTFEQVGTFTLPTSGWGAIRWAGNPIKSVEYHFFRFEELPVSTAGTDANTLSNVAAIGLTGAGSGTFWLARTSARKFLIGSVNAQSDGMPLIVRNLS